MFVFCLCITATLRPTSEKMLVKARIVETMATIPKSFESKYLAKMETLRNPIVTEAREPKEFHLILFMTPPLLGFMSFNPLVRDFKNFDCGQ